MRKFREQCWNCGWYSVYYGRPYCAKSGEMNDDKETKRKCKDFLKKKKKK